MTHASDPTRVYTWTPITRDPRAAVLQALGSASVCWENGDVPTGTFDEAQAENIAHGLLNFLDTYYANERVAQADYNDWLTSAEAETPEVTHHVEVTPYADVPNECGPSAHPYGRLVIEVYEKGGYDGNEYLAIDVATGLESRWHTRVRPALRELRRKVRHKQRLH